MGVRVRRLGSLLAKGYVYGGVLFFIWYLVPNINTPLVLRDIIQIVLVLGPLFFISAVGAWTKIIKTPLDLFFAPFVAVLFTALVEQLRDNKFLATAPDPKFLTFPLLFIGLPLVFFVFIAIGFYLGRVLGRWASLVPKIRIVPKYIFLSLALLVTLVFAAVAIRESGKDLLLGIRVKIGGYPIKKFLDSVLKPNSSLFPDSGLTFNFFSYETKTIHSQPVPSFSGGRIAFIKSGNLWIAENTGVANQITDNANLITTWDNIEPAVAYANPVWSPDGTALALRQIYSSPDASRAIFLKDNTLFSNDSGSGHEYHNLPLFWLDNEAVLVPRQKEGIQTLLMGYGEHDTPYIQALEYSIPDGCGGGGRPAWLTALSNDHLGGLDGIRASLFYLPDIDSIVYSEGCENEHLLVVKNGSKLNNWFDKIRKPYHLDYGDGRWGFHDGPNQLVLSPDKQLIGGVYEGNVVVYNSKGKFLKQLTSSGKAYGPVFSKDNRYIYFADNIGEISLKRVRIDDGGEDELFKEAGTGAIANISLSPDDSQIAFTLIKETLPQGSREDEWYSESRQDIYLISSDGHDPKLLIEGAGQPSWSSR